MPGASEADVDVRVEDDVLSLVGRISMDDYRSRLINPGSVRVYEMASIDLTPVYTEHRVGHFERRFSISTEIDSEGIIGRISDGVLEIELPDVPH
jgi:HSP20 family molecular chaperone IbpA